ncbi:MAG: BatD family protein [Gammaproteobacteria bacterium]
MVRMSRIPSPVLLILLAFAWPAWADIDVSVDRNPVQLNETFQLVFELDESPDRNPDFSALQNDFLVLGNNRSSSISIINGDYRRSVKWTLQLMAKEAGEFEIPAIRFDDKFSKPVKITVKPASPASLPDDKLALEMRVDRTEAYVQSQIILTLRLLSAVDISAYQFGDVAIDNLDTVAEPLGDVRQYQTRVGDKAYLVLEKRFALFPQQTGKLEVSPILAEVRLPSRKAYDPFQTSGEVRRLRSSAVSVEVKPIPAEYNAAYWLPAHKLELRENWQGDPDKLVAGEPVTRSLTLVADGLTAAQLPELPLEDVDGVKQYPDQPLLENRRSGDGIRGVREQKVALIPGNGGRYLLPAIELPWWNLDTGRTEIARLPAREIVVQGAPETVSTAPPDAGKAAEESAAAPAPAPGGNRLWPWLSLVLACGWALSAIYWWFGSRRAPAGRGAAAEPTSLRRARRDLERACARNDALAAREALLAWGRALLAPREVSNLHRLCELLGAPLARQVDELNRCRYAPGHGDWRGEDLWRLCRQLESTREDGKASDRGLAPLNPAG